MNAPSNSVYAIVAAFSLAVAACQPGDAPNESLGHGVDRAAKKIGDQVDRAAGQKKTSTRASRE